MDSYINLSAIKNQKSNHSAPQPVKMDKVVDVLDPKLAYNDHGKSYVSNWEIYSKIPCIDMEKWLNG